jgi:ubiquinone biosynthesis protein
MGEALMLACAALTVALYRTLLNRGLGSTEARAVTAKATASIYDRMADFPWRIARVTARTPIGRLRRATRVFRRFPFGPPGYLMEDVFSDENTVAFDVKRCVVAEHFREQGLPELCVETFCNLDFALAQKWGSTLNRTTTLASGAPHCDFRWQIDPPAPAAKAAGRRRGVEGER